MVAPDCLANVPCFHLAITKDSEHREYCKVSSCATVSSISTYYSDLTVVAFPSNPQRSN